MNDLLDKIFSTSEVLALLIPLIVILVHKPKGPGIRYIVWYVVIAFVLNLAATLIYLFYYAIPESLQNNNILYNLHSFARVILFGLYIINARPYRFLLRNKLILAGYCAFCAYNFIFIDSPLELSSNHFSAESIALLMLCLSYFFRSIQDDSETNWLKHPSFLVAVGVALYETVTFFIFLFFYQLYINDPVFSLTTMRIYVIIYVLLCILLGLALYRTKKLSKA